MSSLFVPGWPSARASSPPPNTNVAGFLLAHVGDDGGSTGRKQATAMPAPTRTAKKSLMLYILRDNEWSFLLRHVLQLMRGSQIHRQGKSRFSRSMKVESTHTHGPRLEGWTTDIIKKESKKTELSFVSPTDLKLKKTSPLTTLLVISRCGLNKFKNKFIQKLQLYYIYAYAVTHLSILYYECYEYQTTSIVKIVDIMMQYVQ
jgi:hypothetical protein